MRRWIMTTALCFFLAGGSQLVPALADNEKSVSESTTAGRSGISRTQKSQTTQPTRPIPIQAVPPGGGSSRPAIKTVPGKIDTVAPIKPSRAVESPKAKPKKENSGQKKSTRPSENTNRPNGKNRPGYSGKPDGSSDRPVGWNSPGHQWNTSNRPHRSRSRNHSLPYYYGPAWNGYYIDNPYVDEDARFGREEAAPEPQTFFSEGQFEVFEDPRLNWVAEGGLGGAAARQQPQGGGSAGPAPAANQTSDSVRQYEQMMKAWQR